jgi:hypothetical protein
MLWKFVLLAALCALVAEARDVGFQQPSMADALNSTFSIINKISKPGGIAGESFLFVCVHISNYTWKLNNTLVFCTGV